MRRLKKKAAQIDSVHGKSSFAIVDCSILCIKSLLYILKLNKIIVTTKRIYKFGSNVLHDWYMRSINIMNSFENHKSIFDEYIFHIYEN